MEPDHIISIRHSLRWVIAATLIMVVGSVTWAVTIGSIGRGHVDFLFTSIALFIAALFIDIHLRAIRQSRSRVIAGLIAIMLSQTFFLVWVWTPLRTESMMYRLWWLTMVPAVISTHLLVLRAATVGRDALIERNTKICVFVLGILLIGLGLYGHFPPQLVPAHKWLIFLFAVAALVGSLVTWRRWKRRRAEPVEMSRGARIGWVCVSYIVVLIVGLYIGRTSAPLPSQFDTLPSALAGMPPDQIDTQVRADLERLKTLAARIENLVQRAGELDAQLSTNLVSEGRTYYVPREEDEIRWQFMSYLSIRMALLRIATTYAGFEAVHDPDLKARCFTVGYAAAMTIFKTSLIFVRTYKNSPMARTKLNEAELQWDIPEGMFDRIFESVTNKQNENFAAEMAAYFESRQSSWRAANIWPKADFEWLENLINQGVQYVKDHPIGTGRAWIDRFIGRVKKDAYSPAYVAQSMVAEWIGDTRIVEQEPLITIAQIESIESQLKPGDIILERRNWCLSNAFLPGFWPHAALYVGRIDDLRRLGITEEDAVKEKLEEYLKPASDGHDHTVIEAVSEGVIFNSLTRSLHADHIAILRPLVSEDKIAHAIVEAFRHEGKPYDFEFDFFTADKLVCTELVYRSYDGILNFDLVTIVGRSTLPALEIVRKFERERQLPNPELGFVLFLDGDRTAGVARLASADEFCQSAERPGAFHK